MYLSSRSCSPEAPFRIWLFLSVEHPNAAEAQGHAVLSQAHVLVRYLGLLFLPVGQTIVPVVSPIYSLRDSRVLYGVVGLAGAFLVGG